MDRWIFWLIHRLELPQGRILYHQNEFAGFFFVLLEGRVEQWDGEPGNSRKLETLKPGKGVLGEIAIRDSTPHRETAIVSSKSAELWCLDRFTLKAISR